MGQRQVNKVGGGQRLKKGAERSAAVHRKLSTKTALPGDPGDSVALPAGRVDLCFLLTTNRSARNPFKAKTLLLCSDTHGDTEDRPTGLSQPCHQL